MRRTNLLDIYASLTLDTSGYESGISSANTKTSSLSATSVAFGQLAAQAVQKVVSAFTDLCSSIVDIGVETETSFAQLETIAGSENIDDLTDSLTELSSQLGISSSELAETAYNAISAGTSTEDAAEMVESAAKLAVAGFTDTDSALSVLTTAINSYGDAAGTAEEISDSLITVQNRGVTTIDELAGSMGKAIATASAYNVDLSNLEASYISLTKAGISTEESTTYLSSMLNELGDSGSDVSAILQEETGKSFGTLMSEGYSLADVMEILNDSVDGDSEALMNLWSSAEAGKASSAIVNQGLDEFNENLETLANSTGATETAYATMADTMATKISIMKTSFENLGLSIYDELEPALSDIVTFVTETVIPKIEKFVETIDFESIIESVSSFMSGTLLPIFSKLADNMDVIIPIIAGVVTALVAFKAAMGISSLISGVSAAIAAYQAANEGATIAQTLFNAVLNANPIVLIVTLIAGLVAAIIVLWNTNDSFREALTSIWESITGIFTNAWSAIQAVWDTVAGFFSGIWSSISSVFSGVGSFFSSKFQTGASNIQSAFSLIGGFFSGIWDDITGVFSGAYNTFLSIGSNIVSGIKQGILNAWESLTSWVTSKFSSLVSGVKSLLGISSPSTVFAAIGGYMAEGLGEGWDAEYASIQSGIEDDLDFGATDVAAASSALGSVFGAIGGSVVNLTQNIYSQAQTAADLLREARWEQERAVLSGV